tara:strand:+ start:647 stop:2932 length:2286 start_codon:yes stop_codon:yes gene_type:complete
MTTLSESEILKIRNNILPKFDNNTLTTGSITASNNITTNNMTINSIGNIKTINNSSSVNINGSLLKPGGDLSVNSINSLSSSDPITIQSIKTNRILTNTGTDLIIGDTGKTKINELLVNNIRNYDTLKTSVNINNSLFSIGGTGAEIRTNIIKKKNGFEYVEIESSKFSGFDCHIKKLFTEEIVPDTTGSFSLNGLEIGDKNINGVCFSNTETPSQNSLLKTNSIKASVIDPLESDKSVKVGGLDISNKNINGVCFNEDEIPGADSTIKTKKLYVTDLFLDTDERDYANINLENVQFKNGVLTCEKMISNSIDTKTISVNNIVQNDSTGVVIDSFKIKDNKLYIPSQESYGVTNPQYGEIYFKENNGNNAIVFKTPDGNEVIPPYLVKWTDWDLTTSLLGTSQNTCNIHHSRFSVIDNGIWLSIDIDFNISTQIQGNKIWFSLPENYKSIQSSFVNFNYIEKEEEWVPVVFKINGNLDTTVCNIEFINTETIETGSYSIKGSIFYEFNKIDNNFISSPWQEWIPSKKDSYIKDINKISSRYYKIGSNMVLSFDISISFNDDIPIEHKVTSLGLPGGVTPRSILFSSPVIIIDEGTKFTGTVNIGRRLNNQAQNLDESTFRIIYPEGFEKDKTYYIQGQVIFEEINSKGFDFFFDSIDNWGVNDNNGSFDINYELTSNIVKFISNGSYAKEKWNNKIIDDTKEIYLNTGSLMKGLTKQVIFLPKTRKSRLKDPWRLIRDDFSIKFQFSLDGRKYIDQFVIYQ